MVEACKFKNRKDINHCHICLITNSISICNQRMNLSQIAYNLTIINHICLSSGMKVSLSAVWIIIYFISHSYFLKELFTYTFHVKEIAVSIHTKCKVHTLIRKFCKRKCFRTIYITKFIETYIFISSVIVRSQRTEHTV